jgi:hypothetical protein
MTPMNDAAAPTGGALARHALLAPMTMAEPIAAKSAPRHAGRRFSIGRLS